jgi:acyl-ACP thioesterase
MMEIYTEHFSVSPEGLCTGDLFRLMQKISCDHSTLLGYSEQKMEELGVMWVIIRHGIQVQRWPGAGEKILARTWPGPTRHSMCPRFYRLESGEGELLITGCAIWSVVDRESRKMVIPTVRGVDFPAVVTGLEGKRPGAPARLETTEHSVYTVGREVLDENRHMNNTRYYDLAEDCLGTRGRPLRRALAEYLSESREGERLRLAWGLEGERCCLSGERDGPAFRLELEYFPGE